MMMSMLELKLMNYSKEPTPYSTSGLLIEQKRSLRLIKEERGTVQRAGKEEKGKSAKGEKKADKDGKGKNPKGGKTAKEKAALAAPHVPIKPKGAAKLADRPSAIIGTKLKPPPPFLWGGGEIYISHKEGMYRVKKRAHHKVDDKVRWHTHGGCKGAWQIPLNRIAD